MRPRAPHAGLQKQGNTIGYEATDGSDLAVTIVERRCIDSQTGSLFAYAVGVKADGRSYTGCAAYNPAMPAP